MELRIVLPQDKNDICRFCLGINPNVKHCLFQGTEPTKLHALLSALQLNVNHDEILPNNVCSNCEQQLQAFHSFKFMVVDNEKILRCVYTQSTVNNQFDTDPGGITDIKNTPEHEDCDFDLDNDLDILLEDNNVKEEQKVKVKKKRRKVEPGEKTTNRSKISMCKNCGKEFRKDYLKKHTVRCKGVPGKNEEPIEEEQIKVFNCGVCGEIFDSELRLSLHYIQHFLYEETERIDPVVFCNFCGFILQTYDEYLVHVSEKHPDNYTQSWICKMCNNAFPTEFELISHTHTQGFCKNIKIDNSERYCLICKKEFEGPLNNHLKNHLLKRHSCLKCEDKFIVLIAHNHHLLTHPEYKYKCRYCSRMFVLKSNMEKHIKEMHQDEKFICDQCSKIFNRKNNLESHIKQKHDNKCKKIICPLCGYSTVSKHDLKRHERFHTNVKPFVCNFNGCTKAYKTSSALSHHKKTHLNIRNYTCDICEKSFYTSNHLKDHMYIHTGERNFVCTLCEHSFKRKDQLSAHSKIHKLKNLENVVKHEMMPSDVI